MGYKFKVQRNFIKCRNCGQRWDKREGLKDEPHRCPDPMTEEIRKMGE